MHDNARPQPTLTHVSDSNIQFYPPANPLYVFKIELCVICNSPHATRHVMSRKTLTESISFDSNATISKISK